MLLAKGHTVVVLDNLSYGHRPAVPASGLVVGDLRDVDHLDQLLIGHRIEAVIHFAAFAYVGESVTDPAKYYLNNLVHSAQPAGAGPPARHRQVRLLQHLRHLRRPGRGADHRGEAAEADQPVRQHQARLRAHAGRLRPGVRLGYAALRYFNAAGAAPDGTIGEDHDPETHLIPLVIQAAVGKRPHVDVFGTDYPTPDGTCVRDYIHVDDLAAAHLLALEQIVPGVGAAYNVGIGRGYSVREVIRTVEEVTGKKVPVQEGPRRPGDPPALVAAADKVRRELGWSPRYTDLRPIVETAWNWHRAHPNGYAKG